MPKTNVMQRQHLCTVENHFAAYLKLKNLLNLPDLQNFWSYKS